MKTRIQSSKIMLVLVVSAGLVLIYMGLFTERNNLIGYGLMLGVSVFNRLDSRARGYKLTIQAGTASACVESPGAEEDHG